MPALAAPAVGMGMEPVVVGAMGVLVGAPGAPGAPGVVGAPGALGAPGVPGTAVVPGR